MVKFKVPLNDILGRAYYQYELSSSNYNPNINETITITCTCKNILGNPIADKELELMMNGVSQGTSTTNANGIATYEVTVIQYGITNFSIENVTIEVSTLNTLISTTTTCNSNLHFTSTQKINLWRDGSIVIASLWNTTCKPVSTGWLNIASIPYGYRPVSDVYGVQTSNATQINQVGTVNKNTIRAYVSSVPSSNVYFGLLMVWKTTDTYE